MDELKCHKCNLFLSVPPITHNGGCFLCGRCSTPENPRILVYEKLAKQYVFPCRYSKNGCTETNFFGAIGQHEATCDKRPLICPFPNCTNLFLEEEIEEHFRNFHEKHLQDTNVFQLNIDGAFTCKLLLEQYLIVLVMVERSKNFLRFNVMHVGKNFNKIYTKYQLKIHSEGFKETLQLSPRTMERFGCETPGGKRHIINKNFLQYFSTQFWMEICLAPELDSQRNFKELLQVLECPVCFEHMSQVKQCQTGHSFCKSCAEKLNKCPICRVNFPDVTNYLVETLSKQLLFPCKNHAKGCVFYGKSSEKELHEKDCYECPLRVEKKCNMIGELQEVIAHSQQEHTCYPGIMRGAKCAFDSKSSTYLIYTDGRLFVYTRYVDEKYMYWNVMLYGPRRDAGGYRFVISFTQGGHPMTFTQICKAFSEDKYDLQTHLKLPIEMLKPFVKQEAVFCNIVVEKLRMRKSNG